ncbi:MAG: peptidylprolyl isomerase [Bacteroidota bacterium]
MKKLFLLVISIAMCFLAQAQQGKLIDEIVGVVGENIILESEVEIEFQQLQKEMPKVSDSVKCEILKQQIINKLMLTKAQLDSIELPDERVDGELEKRIRYFAAQFGGEKAMEDFYGKTITEIKANNREKIRSNMLVQEMQGKILKDVKVSPTDIKKYYNELDKMDSLPYYSAEIEVAQLIIQPKVSSDAKQIALQKITELRDRIVSGEEFSTLALIYSDDKGSAAKGGELGYFSRGDMVPEFEAAAFKLKPDSISKIIETKFGYHFLKLVNRKGDNINVRHILIRPQIFRSDIEIAKQKMDSIIWQIKIDSLTFENAAKKYSDDMPTKANGGFITEGQIGTTKVPIDELPKDLYFIIEKMKPGEMSEPEQITIPGPDREKAWRVMYLKSESKPHECNMKDDYQKLQAMAFQRKQQKAMQDWIEGYRKKIYIHVSDSYQNCPSLDKFTKK